LVVPLGKSPVSEKYLTEENILEEQDEVPLDLYYCQDCSHVQLIDVVDPKFLWSDLTFQTANNPELIDHFQDIANRILKVNAVNSSDFIIDIGSNDGTLLRCFQDMGYVNVLGVEPSNEISALANENGITTLNTFFNEKISKEIYNKYGKAKIITANNVYAHIDDLSGITKAIKKLMDNDSLFVFEVSYLLDVVQKMLIGTIFHEHLSYHSVKALQKFLYLHGLELVRVDRGPEQGGSIVGYVQLKGAYRDVDESVTQLLQLEKKYRLDDFYTIQKMYTKLESVKLDIIKTVADIRSNGKVIAGFGAARAGTTLLSYFKIGDSLDFLVDDNESKHYKYSPGDRIKVLPTSAIYEKKPDYLLILAWLYTDKIINKHNEYIKNGGSFIKLLPNVEIVSE
jgi:hypothetical protein